MGLSAALCDSCDVTLVGPSGSGRGTRRIRSRGYIEAEVSVRHVECGDPVESELAVVALKAYDISSCAGAIGRGAGGIICLSNGMALEGEFGAQLWSRVEPAVVTLGFLVADPGTVVVSPGEITVAEGGEAARLFRSAKLPVREVSSMETYRWAKWLVNSAINPLGALTGLRNDELREAGISGLLEGIMSELKAMVPEPYRSKAVEAAEETMVELLSESTNRCSMLQDLEAGRRTEIDYLTGLAADELKQRAPLASAVTALVRARERRSF